MTRYSDKADEVVRFIESYCTHVKGELGGKPLILEGWQKEDIIYPLFGDYEDGVRKYRMAYIEIPRKNAKSTLCAALALYLLLSDNEPGAEVYSAAADRGQAGIIFDIARQMVLQNKTLQKYAEVYRNSIVKKGTNSFYKAISADADTKHGFNSHGILFDELHTQPNRDLWDVLTTSTGSRKQPLIIAITTAGFDKNSICWEMHEYARKVAEGSIKDPTFLPVIYKADEDDDIYSEATWKKANPGLGSIVRREYIQDQVNKIRNNPSFENTFRRLHLNQWTQSETRWIKDEHWMYNITEYPVFTNIPCYAGLDLASTRDITALVLMFVVDGTYHVVPYFWLPEQAMKDRTEAPYYDWYTQGFINVTDGNVTDYNFIKQAIVDICDEYNVRQINFDRWNASQLVIDLTEQGVPMTPFGQGYASMSAPTKELEKVVLSKSLNHAGNPVLRWMCANVLIKEDPAGNIKIDKGKSVEKVDGMVALVMALGAYMNSEKPFDSTVNPISIL